MKWWCLVPPLVLACLPRTNAANILALCTVASHSHSLWCYKFMEALVERGHQVTVFGFDKPSKHITNLTTFIAEGVYEAIYNKEVTDLFTNSRSAFQCISNVFEPQNKITTTATLHSEGFKRLLKTYENITRPFDLIIHDHLMCLGCVGLVHHFNNPPLVLATAYDVPEWWMINAGNFPHPAYVPNILLPYSQHMTFYEKSVNLFIYLLSYYVYKYKIVPNDNRVMREVFGPDVPSAADIVKNANIMMVNHHYSIDGARPQLPGVIPIAGLHMDEPKPLPQDLQEFMDSAKNGVILLSFGSNVAKTWLPENVEETLMKAFQGLPQKVLWKWERIPAGLPRNMQVVIWLPQNDILAHPNMRLYVTHCGILSYQEAIGHGVPMLTLPVFLDQYANANHLQQAGVSLTQDIARVTSDELRQTIEELLQNPQYKMNMEKMGELIRDMPMTARQQAVFWTEYALRHNGAPHLRSAAADMPWHQLLLLDVLAAMVLAGLLVLWTFTIIATFLFRLVVGSSSKPKSD